MDKTVVVDTGKTVGDGLGLSPGDPLARLTQQRGQEARRSVLAVVVPCGPAGESAEIRPTMFPSPSVGRRGRDPDAELVGVQCVPVCLHPCKTSPSPRRRRTSRPRCGISAVQSLPDPRRTTLEPTFLCVVRKRIPSLAVSTSRRTSAISWYSGRSSSSLSSAVRACLRRRARGFLATLMHTLLRRMSSSTSSKASTISGSNANRGHSSIPGIRVPESRR